MKRKYGPPKMNRKNQIVELSTKYRIFNAVYAKQVSMVDNEMVYDKLINKSNAYNPFLTRMNYKITFKTWLKHAKATVAKANVQLNKLESSQDDSAQPMFYEIAIEVETEVEYTSEDDEPKFSSSVKRGRSMLGSSIGQLRKSARDSGAKRSYGASGKKSTDHLQLFQAKMRASIADSLKKRKSAFAPALNGLSPR